MIDKKDQLIELGSILHMTKGKKPLIKAKEKQENFLPYVDIKAFEQNIIDNYASAEKSVLCEDGDLLIVCDGSRSGLTGRAIKGVVGSTLSKVSANGLITDYLDYFIQSKFALLNTRKKGTGTPHLNVELLKKSKIYVPPLEEQERIVAKIEELFSNLDNSIAELTTAKEKLKIYRQAVLKEAFEGCSEWVELNSVCEHITDGDHMPPPKSESGIPFIMISNVKDNKIDFTNTNFVSNEYFNNLSMKRRPIKGDVLYTVTGSYGIPILVDYQKDFCFQRHIALLRPKNNIKQKFLYYALQLPSTYKQATDVATGTAQKTVGLTVLRKIEIPFNDNPENQELIINDIESKMSVHNSVEQAIDKSLQQAEALRQSILKNAFEGKL